VNCLIAPPRNILTYLLTYLPRDTRMTNGLRHGMQFGMPMTEEIVAVCMGMCVVRARPWREFQNVYHGMHWHALSLNSCA